MIRTERKEVFGYIIDNHHIDAGDVYYGNITKEIKSCDMANKAFYVKGHITTNTNNPSFTFDDFTAGTMYEDVAPEILPVSNIAFTAVESSEWWCYNVRLNRADITLKKLILKSGEETNIPPKTKILVCEGQLNGDLTLQKGESVITENTCRVTSDTDTYCLIFED